MIATLSATQSRLRISTRTRLRVFCFSTGETDRPVHYSRPVMRGDRTELSATGFGKSVSI
jgi:hypothetical protein